MKDNYENNNEHNPNKKRKTLIAFNDTLADVPASADSNRTIF